MPVEKGWGSSQEVDDEELANRREETAEEYRKEIAALKQEELKLTENIKNLREQVDSALANRSAELDVKASELTQKLSDAENLNIRLKALVAEQESGIAKLEIDKKDFEDYRVEKQSEIDATLAEISCQKDDLGRNVEFQMTKEVDFNNAVIKHESDVSQFNELNITIESKMAEANALMEQAKAEMAKAKEQQETNAATLQSAVNAKVEYESKLANISSDRESIIHARDEYLSKVNSVNAEKVRLNDVSLQQKAERLALDKKAADLNEQQGSININLTKLESLKQQLGNSVKEN